MDRFRVLLVAFSVFFSFTFSASAQVDTPPIKVLIPYSPATFTGSDNQLHLAYELHLTNSSASDDSLTITSLSVFSNQSKSSIATFNGVDLMNLLNYEEMPKTGTNLVIQPGKRTVFFVWLTLPLGNTFPQSLHQTITFTDRNKTGHTLVPVNVKVNQKAVWALGAPLRGRTWLVDEGPGNPKSHHWGSILAQNGVITIPQRFAIDFFALNDAGHAVEAPPDKLNQTANKQWIGFGTDVLAVHDAVVCDMRDSIADHAPLAALPQPEEITARSVYGNFIILKVAPGVFVHYAHLRHGSIRVKIGQHVKMGDVIANLGDSGNAGAPHLHFHVSDRPTFELSEGVPFVFSKITLLGKTNEGAMLNPASKFKTKAVIQHNVLPLYDDVLKF